MNYATVSADAKNHNEKNDCAVRAISIVLGVPYSWVHRALKQRNRQNGDGTSNAAIWEVLKDFGARVSVLQEGKGATAKQLENCPLKSRYLVWFPGHIAAMVNGQLEDWTHDSDERVEVIMRIITPGLEPC